MLSFLKVKKNQEEVKRLEREIVDLKNQIEQIKGDIKSEKHSLNSYELQVKNKKEILESYNTKIRNIEIAEDYGIVRYTETYDELQEARSELSDKILSEVGYGLYSTVIGYSLNNSASEGAKLQKAFGDGVIYAFNAYVDSKEKSITSGNLIKTQDLIKNKFNSYQKKAQKIGVALNAKYAQYRIDMLELQVKIKLKEKEEKERIRKEKQKMREEEKLLEEIAREEEKLKKEQKAMNIAFGKALTDKERNEIREKMNKIDKRLDSLQYRREHSGSGWLYVISSPSLPNMIKLGVTRRLNPAIRVNELSSSSLPYPFISHGFVFSDDCFELEANIHKYFDDERVSPNREFFYVSPEKAIRVLEVEFNQKVHSFYNPEILESEVNE